MGSRRIEVNVANFSLDVSDAKKLRALEAENGKLKRLVADLSLDNIDLTDRANVINRCRMMLWRFVSGCESWLNVGGVLVIAVVDGLHARLFCRWSAVPLLQLSR
jgi:hypothetical protein